MIQDTSQTHHRVLVGEAADRVLLVCILVLQPSAYLQNEARGEVEVTRLCQLSAPITHPHYPQLDRVFDIIFVIIITLIPLFRERLLAEVLHFSASYLLRGCVVTDVVVHL